MRIHPPAVVLLAITLGACASAASPGPPRPNRAASCTPWCIDSVAPGIAWKQGTFTGSAVNVVDVDLARPGIQVRPVRPTDSTYRTVAMMGDSTPRAVAGVNGGFFLYGTNDDICGQCAGNSCPIYRASSLLQIGGTSFSTNCRTSRSAFGIDAQGGTHFTVLPPNTPWAGMPYAVGAGPTLVRDGQVVPLTDTTQMFPWIESAHPRTAVAVDGRGHLLLVTVDAPGLSLPLFASLLHDVLDAREAMNLDGGGSTTMWIRGQANGGVVNCPSSGPSCGQRAVYDGLYVIVS